MALVNYNLKQITNNDIIITEETDNYGNLKKYFQLSGKRGNIETIKSKNVNGDIVEYEYFIFTTTHFGGLPMLKLGYICEPNAFTVPIYITFYGSSVMNKFELGKTGIFEIQPEQFIDKNISSDLVQNITFEITELRIPVGFSFSVDYITDEEANRKDQA